MSECWITKALNIVKCEFQQNFILDFLRKMFEIIRLKNESKFSKKLQKIISKKFLEYAHPGRNILNLLWT